MARLTRPRKPKAAPPETHDWPDGINPYMVSDTKIDGPARRQAIIDTRLARAAGLDAWQPGAGVEYLAAMGVK